MVDQISFTPLGGVGATGEHTLGAPTRLSLGRWLVTRERDRRRERILGTVLIVVAVILAAWTVYIGSSDAPRAIHRPWSLESYLGINPYTLIWVGIDVLETAGLVMIGILLRAGRPATHTIALLTLPLFVLDAWFDILTSVSVHHLVVAILMAAVSEVPAAVVCGWIAWKSARFRT
jgi:hypothetical protein